MTYAQQLRRLNKLESDKHLKLLGSYTTYRDENANVVATFSNNNVYHFPSGIKFRYYQSDVLHEFVNGMRQFFFVWPRRHGKEVLCWNFLLQAAVETPGDYVIIYPTFKLAKNVIWNGGITLEDGSLLKFRDMLPTAFVDGKPNQAELMIKLINGSNIYVRGSQDADSLRGTNYRGIIISEFAYCDPEIYRALQPILTQNKGWLILQTTFNGMNHAYQLMQKVKVEKDWYTRVESIETLKDENGNSYITEEDIEKDRRSGMPEFKIQQEYYSVVSRNEESMYFASTLNLIEAENRITNHIALPGVAANVGFDIGVDDATAMSIFQLDEHNRPRILHYFEKNGQNAQFYLEYFKTWCIQHHLPVGTVCFPHDGKNRTFAVSTPLQETAIMVGIDNCIFVPRPASEYMAIQHMREMLYSTLFEEAETRRLRECLGNFSKERDEKREIWREKPRHDWASHGVKSYQTLTLAIRQNLISNVSAPVITYNQ